MKTSDRLLLHALDAATPGGLRRHHARSLVVFIAHACGYLAAFVLGFAAGAP